MDNFIIFGIYALFAFCLAIGSVIFFSVALSSISARVLAFEKWFPIVLVAMIGFLMCAGGFLNARNLQYASLGAGFIESDRSSAYLWISRLTSIALVGLAIPYFVFKALQWFKHQRYISWPLFNIIFFSLSCFLIPCFLGAVPYLDHRALYPVLMMVAIYLVTENGSESALVAIKWSVFIFLIISLAFLVVDYQRVMAPGYRGWIPILNSRFWGLAPHANAIGPMAGLVVFLELLFPSRFRFVRFFIFTSAATVLILAQSKTSIAATVLGLFVIFYSRFGRLASERNRVGFVFHKGHLFLLVLGVFFAALILFSANVGLLNKISSRLDAVGVTSSVESMSGRTIIWEAALREYRNNPIFGYGPTLWDDNYRRAIGLNYAYHAHNQILQTMAASGTLGLLGLLAFLLFTMRRALETCRLTDGVSVAIVILVLFRMVTEVPLSPTGIGNGEMLSIIAMICIWRIKGKIN